MSPRPREPAGDALPSLREMLDDERLRVVDGAMGTMLYARGVFVNVCYEALVLEEPDQVARIHREYVDAGAEILETNTFGANPVKLSSFGLEDATEEINRVAARLAVEAADGRARVLGAVGPLGVRLEPWGPTSVKEAAGYFRRQMTALLEGGADGLLLETFADIHEVETALATARTVAGDRPVFAQMTVAGDGRTSFGTDAIEALVRLEEAGADAVGLNCSVGPATLLEVLEAAAERIAVPLVAQPNAGLPRTVGDRKIYMASPEYMARYARRFLDAGVRFVGGCCGTTPEHIGQIALVVRGLQPRHTHAHLAAHRAGTTTPRRDAIPLEERSTLGRALAERAFITTVELVPPRGWDAGALVSRARKASAAGATAVTVVDSARGRSRMGALPATSVLLGAGVAEPVMHYTCRDRNMMGMLSDLLGAAALGVRNVLLVSGDPPTQGPYPDATAVFDIDSIGLTNVVDGLNHGVDPGGSDVGEPTRFVVGVAVNPGAVDLDREISRFRWKVEAGADFAVTQPLYDPELLQAFLEAAARGAVAAGDSAEEAPGGTGEGARRHTGEEARRYTGEEAHRHTGEEARRHTGEEARRHTAKEARFPVLVGLWPFTSVRNAEFLANEVPGVSVPAAVVERMRKAQERGAAAARAEGIAIAREVLAAVRTLDGVAGVHLSTPGDDLDAALAVLEEGPP